MKKHYKAGPTFFCKFLNTWIMDILWISNKKLSYTLCMTGAACWEGCQIGRSNFIFCIFWAYNCLNFIMWKVQIIVIKIYFLRFTILLDNLIKNYIILRETVPESLVTMGVQWKLVFPKNLILIIQESFLAIRPVANVLSRETENKLIKQ